MDATYDRSENRFGTIINLYKLVNILRINILSIIDINHGSIIFISMKLIMKSSV